MYKAEAKIEFELPHLILVLSIITVRTIENFIK
jgi:hypothetical protein